MIDNHVHIGVDPLFYLKGWFPYCLDFERLLGEAKDSGVDSWVVFPFVSYMALDQAALRQSRIEISHEGESIPYRFENHRLLNDLRRMDPTLRKRFRPFLIADPGRHASAQVRVWEELTKTHRVHGIKIQPTIIQSPITTLLAKGRCMLDFAEERNLPFLIHSSISPADAWSQCADILRVAEARPKIRFVLAHSCRFHHESLRRVASLPNTWFDCSAHVIHCQCAVDELPTVAVKEERFPSDYSSAETVLSDLAMAFPEKLIWGSDAPFYSYEDDKTQLRSSYWREVEVLNSLPEDVREAVAHRNTLAWLGQPE